VQIIQFGLVSIIGLGINNLIVVTFDLPFDHLLRLLDAPDAIAGYIPAKMLATLVVLFWNFFVNRYWTYNDID
jgi:hypothetical protein